MKSCFLNYGVALTCLVSAPCSAASFQTKDFTLQLPGDWQAQPVREHGRADVHEFRSTSSAGVVLILVTKTWLGAKQNRVVQLEHANSLAVECLKGQFEDPPTGPVELDRCEIAGTKGFCTEYVVHPKGTTGIKGICMGWPGDDGLVYTANWSDALPEADSSIVGISAALKSIELPKRPDK